MNSVTKINEAVTEWDDDAQAEYLAQQEERYKARLILYSSLEDRLGISKGFIDKLREEADDWAYIVKLAVLCEASVTHILVASVANAESRDVWYEHFSSLNNSRRLELAHKLNALPKTTKLQLDAIAQFRNSFAHEVKNLGGSLSSFFEQCSSDKKRELSSKLLGITHTNDQDWRFYIANTRLLIAVGAISAIKVLAEVGQDKSNIDELEKQWELADMYRGTPTPLMNSQEK